MAVTTSVTAMAATKTTGFFRNFLFQKGAVARIRDGVSEKHALPSPHPLGHNWVNLRPA